MDDSEAEKDANDVSKLLTVNESKAAEKLAINAHGHFIDRPTRTTKSNPTMIACFREREGEKERE